MRTTQQLSITLPNDMADVVKAKVRTGEPRCGLASTPPKAKSSATAYVRFWRVIEPSKAGCITK